MGCSWTINFSGFPTFFLGAATRAQISIGILRMACGRNRSLWAPDIALGQLTKLRRWLEPGLLVPRQTRFATSCACSWSSVRSSCRECHASMRRRSRAPRKPTWLRPPRQVKRPGALRATGLWRSHHENPSASWSPSSAKLQNERLGVPWLGSSVTRIPRCVLNCGLARRNGRVSAPSLRARRSRCALLHGYSRTVST